MRTFNSLTTVMKTEYVRNKSGATVRTRATYSDWQRLGNRPNDRVNAAVEYSNSCR
jgi:hypothetical protein